MFSRVSTLAAAIFMSFVVIAQFCDQTPSHQSIGYFITFVFNIIFTSMAFNAFIKTLQE